MSEPVVLVVRAVPKPGRTEDVLAVLREVVPLVHDEPGVLLYSIHRHENGDIYFIEKWASAEDAERHATASPVLPTLQEKASPLLESIPEIITLSPLAIGGPKGAI